MRGGLPHRPGYAVVPQLEPGAVRRAMALRGKEWRESEDGRPLWRRDRFETAALTEHVIAPPTGAITPPESRGYGFHIESAHGIRSR
jgi:hypothetical protein